MGYPISLANHPPYRPKDYSTYVGRIVYSVSNFSMVYAQREFDLSFDKIKDILIKDRAKTLYYKKRAKANRNQEVIPEYVSKYLGVEVPFTLLATHPAIGKRCPDCSGSFSVGQRVRRRLWVLHELDEVKTRNYQLAPGGNLIAHKECP